MVTGASSGLGIETARVLARAGGDVVMACRDTATGERVAAELRTGFGPNAGTLSVAALDLADLDSGRRVRARDRRGRGSRSITSSTTPA
ncbi:MAG: SDR family NAD(P)-dependent oxidoreductase [Deltaproteobacteria bacterium]|nr:SDR family NAD(P)-dependent oxidoreductase [Deltaproteobacteria bacterium]